MISKKDVLIAAAVALIGMAGLWWNGYISGNQENQLKWQSENWNASRLTTFYKTFTFTFPIGAYKY